MNPLKIFTFISSVQPTPPQYQQMPSRTGPVSPQHRTALEKTSAPDHYRQKDR